MKQPMAAVRPVPRDSDSDPAGGGRVGLASGGQKGNWLGEKGGWLSPFRALRRLIAPPHRALKIAPGVKQFWVNSQGL